LLPLRALPGPRRVAPVRPWRRPRHPRDPAGRQLRPPVHLGRSPRRGHLYLPLPALALPVRGLQDHLFARAFPLSKAEGPGPVVGGGPGPVDPLRVVAADFVAGAGPGATLPAPTQVEIAFGGRSNVGKSSLINALCSRKGLVRVSSTPGSTRQINLYQ